MVPWFSSEIIRTVSYIAIFLEQKVKINLFSFRQANADGSDVPRGCILGGG